MSAVLSGLGCRRTRATSLSFRCCAFSCKAGALGWAGQEHSPCFAASSSVARSVCLTNETSGVNRRQPSSNVIRRHQVVIRWSSGGIRWSSGGHQVPGVVLSSIAAYLWSAAKVRLPPLSSIMGGKRFAGGTAVYLIPCR